MIPPEANDGDGLSIDASSRKSDAVRVASMYFSDKEAAVPGYTVSTAGQLSQRPHPNGAGSVRRETYSLTTISGNNFTRRKRVRRGANCSTED